MIYNKPFSCFICLLSCSRIFRLYGDVTTVGEGLQNLGQYLALTSGGSMNFKKGGGEEGVCAGPGFAFAYGFSARVLRIYPRSDSHGTKNKRKHMWVYNLWGDGQVLTPYWSGRILSFDLNVQTIVLFIS